MKIIRAILFRHRALAAVLLGATLCLKALLPVGYMIESSRTVLTISICSAASGQTLARQIAIPENEASGANGLLAKGDCPYSALSMDALGGADPALLALALAFILTLGFVARPMPTLRQSAHLRPPLRAPPLA